jgi:hypothetical protein
MEAWRIAVQTTETLPDFMARKYLSGFCPMRGMKGA